MHWKEKYWLQTKKPNGYTRTNHKWTCIIRGNNGTLPKVRIDCFALHLRIWANISFQLGIVAHKCTVLDECNL